MKIKGLLVLLLLLTMLSTGFSFIAFSENVSSSTQDPQPGNNVNVAPLQVGAEVAIIKDATPWDTPSNELALQELGIQYDIINSANLATADLSQYNLIIIASDQYTSTYNNLIANKDKLAQWVENGGALVAHACDMGWKSGHWSQSFLPGGVDHVNVYLQNLHIVDPTHPVVQGLNDNDISGWYYSTHGYFTNLPNNAHIIVVTQNPGEPTFITYGYGSGLVIATMQTIEWGWRTQVGVKDLLRNEFEYSLGLLGEWVEEEGPPEGPTWEYVFEDARRGTILRVSTDDMLFQFIAPDKDYGVKQAQKMVIRDIRRGGQYIRIYHTEDTDDNGRPDLRFYSRINTRVDRCFAVMRDIDARRTYVLLDRPGIE